MSRTWRWTKRYGYILHNIDIPLVFTGYSNNLRDSTGEIRDSHDIPTPLDGGTAVQQFARHAFLKVEWPVTTVSANFSNVMLTGTVYLPGSSGIVSRDFSFTRMHLMENTEDAHRNCACNCYEFTQTCHYIYLSYL